jgi:hypothetical protein
MLRRSFLFIAMIELNDTGSVGAVYAGDRRLLRSPVHYLSFVAINRKLLRSY